MAVGCGGAWIADPGTEADLQRRKKKKAVEPTLPSE
jgi:hypothetical protein